MNHLVVSNINILLEQIKQIREHAGLKLETPKYTFTWVCMGIWLQSQEVMGLVDAVYILLLDMTIITRV